jgi:hypothetical protein
MTRSAKWLAAGFAALVLVAAPAWANGVNDPQIIIRGGGGHTVHLTPGNTTTTLSFNNDPRCTPTTGVISNVVVPAMTCGVHNATNTDIYVLTFTIIPAQIPLVVCPIPANCLPGTWSVNTAGTIATFVFTNPLPSPGDLYIDFLGFQLGTPIGFDAKTPEPATMLLFASGLGVVALRRRFRRA